MEGSDATVAHPGAHGRAGSRARAILLALALAGLPDAASADEVADVWRASGGTLTLSFYPHLLAGLRSELAVPDASRLTLALSSDHELRFLAPSGLIEAFVGGELRTEGGLRWQRGDRSLAAARLILAASEANGQRWTIRDDSGRVWFELGPTHLLINGIADHLHLRSANLLLGEDLARALGVPETAGGFLGRARFHAPIVHAGVGVARRSERNPCEGFQLNWHGLPLPPPNQAQSYRTDVVLENLTRLFHLGCLGCDGPGPTNGQVKLAPDAWLRNSDTQTTADVPWYSKFVGHFGMPPGNPMLPPYGNDQHPFLIFNLYRLDAAGRFEQIGKSGLKHAFLSINDGCTATCPSNNILFRRCGDVYTAESNDTANDLGPRHELIPHLGIWGRCGSVYDPDCNGFEDPPGYDAFTYRMVVSEHDLEAARNPGARYFFDAHYLIRDDIDITNTMGWREVRPEWLAAASRWQMTQLSPFANGPALEGVVPLGVASDRSHVRLQTPEGELRVAVRVFPAGAAFRYEYVLLNLDYSRPVTQGAEPNLRVLRNLGVGQFTVPVDRASASQVSMRDADQDPANDWTVADSGDLRYTAPAGNTLDWGSAYRYSFVSPFPPAPGLVRLGIAEPGTPTERTAAALVPLSDRLHGDGFEGQTP